MRNFIKWLKMDFIRTRAELSVLINRKVPMWAFVLYYIAWLPIAVWFAPFAYYFEVIYVPRKLKKLLEEKA